MKNLIESQKKAKTQRAFNKTALSVALSKAKSHFLYQPLQIKLGEKKMNRLAAFCGLMALLFLLWACSAHNRHKQDLKPPIPVIVAKIHKSDVPLYLNTIGTVTPLESVI